MARYAPVIEAFEYTGDDAALAAWLAEQGIEPDAVPPVEVGDYLLGGASPTGTPTAGTMPKAMFEASYAPV